jgi:hypothetical protein
VHNFSVLLILVFFKIWNFIEVCLKVWSLLDSCIYTACRKSQFESTTLIDFHCSKLTIAVNDEPKIPALFHVVLVSCCFAVRCLFLNLTRTRNLVIEKINYTPVYIYLMFNSNTSWTFSAHQRQGNWLQWYWYNHIICCVQFIMMMTNLILFTHRSCIALWSGWCLDLLWACIAQLLMLFTS